MRSLKTISWLTFFVCSGYAAQLLGAPPTTSAVKLPSTSGGNSYGTGMSALGEYLFGQAAVMQGTATLVQSQAAAAQTLAQTRETNVKVMDAYEKVRALRLDNEVKYASTFYEKRKMYEQYRNAKRDRVPLASLADFPSAAKPVREPGKAAPPAAAPGGGRPGGAPGPGAPPAAGPAEGRPAREPGKASAPPAPPAGGRPARLASYQTRLISRRVVWPQLLCRECFDQQRAEIVRLLGERTVENSGVGTRNCEDIQQVVDQMKSLLKGQIKSVRPEDYLNAKKFLENVASEARLAVDPIAGRVAMSF